MKAAVPPKLSAAIAKRAALRPCAGNFAWHHERQSALGRDATDIAHHVAALGRIDVEWRRRPSLRAEDRPEQERPPFDRNTRLGGLVFDAHGAQIQIGRRELVPEDKFRL